MNSLLVNVNIGKQAPHRLYLWLWRSDWVLGRAVIVYQILYTDVSDHLPEYATLKAMGYSDAYLIGLSFKVSSLSSLGFVPGFCSRLDFTPFQSDAFTGGMKLSRATSVLVLTIIMCWSGSDRQTTSG